MPPPDHLLISTQHLATIIDHVRSEIPYEACGLLGGVGGEVREVYITPNTAPQPATGFKMDPQAQLNVLLALEERGWNLVAIYHSHPPGQRTDPSPTDVAQASFPDSLHVILTPDAVGEHVSFRAFLIRDDQVLEVPVTITE
jgi:proteasome lid subunit RPN8/RPN11